MTNLAILDRLTPLLREIFDDDGLVATPELMAHQVRGWDSLGSVRVFLEIEQVFLVRFSATEISSLRNVGEIADLIEKKVERNAP